MSLKKYVSLLTAVSRRCFKCSVTRKSSPGALLHFVSFIARVTTVVKIAKLSPNSIRWMSSGLLFANNSKRYHSHSCFCFSGSSSVSWFPFSVIKPLLGF